MASENSGYDLDLHTHTHIYIYVYIRKYRTTSKTKWILGISIAHKVESSWQVQEINNVCPYRITMLYPI
jgi:hypothetical protein